jgi:hypothetical protein
MNSAAPTAKMPRVAWIALGLLTLLCFVHFWWETTPVRLANPDDVAFQAASHGDRAAYLDNNGHSQGRFYFLLPLFRYVFFRPCDVTQPWAFSLIRAVAFFTQVGLAAWLAARVMQSAIFGVTLVLFLVGTLHIPPTFFLLLSFPPSWLGFSALLGALLCHCEYVRQPRLLTGLLTAILYLLATLMHEIFVIYLPLFFAVSLLRERCGWRRPLHDNIGPIAVAVSYVAVYLLFATRFPSSYDGTRFSANFTAAGQVVFRQMTGIIPGFELVVNRPSAETAGPLFRDAAEITSTMAGVTWPGVLLAIGTALGLTYAFSHCLRASLPRARYWPWALGFACLANVPIAFSAKYQVFIFHREYPYAYAYYSFFFLGVAIIGALVCLGRRVPEGTGRRLVIGLFGLVAIALCYSAVASNHRVLQILQHRYN